MYVVNNRKAYMKRTLFFSLTVATGITIIELLMFFFYFTWDTQRNLMISTDKLAKDTFDVIKNNFDIDNDKSKETILKLKLHFDDIHAESKEADDRANRTLYVKGVVLSLLLILSVVLSYTMLDNRSNIRNDAFGIVIGIVSGALTQFLFVKTFVYNYQKKNLLKYVLSKIDDITKIC